jgi:hypothetical protein
MKVKDEVVLVVTTGWMTPHSGLLKLCQARAEFASLAIAIEFSNDSDRSRPGAEPDFGGEP